MGSALRESQIEAHLVKLVKQHGGYCIKLPAVLYKGIPDRVLFLPGARTVFVELKTKSGRQSAMQRKWQQWLEALGFAYHIPRSKQDVEELINEICTAQLPADGD